MSILYKKRTPCPKAESSFIFVLLNQIDDCNGNYTDRHKAGKHACHNLYKKRIVFHMYLSSFILLFRILKVSCYAIGDVLFRRPSLHRYFAIYD